MYRRLVLDRSEGVRMWALRLTGPEAAVVVSDVAFVERADEDGGVDSGEDDGAPKKQEEEEEGVVCVDIDMALVAYSKSSPLL